MMILLFQNIKIYDKVSYSFLLTLCFFNLQFVFDIYEYNCFLIQVLLFHFLEPTVKNSKVDMYILIEFLNAKYF